VRAPVHAALVLRLDSDPHGDVRRPGRRACANSTSLAEYAGRIKVMSIKVRHTKPSMKKSRSSLHGLMYDLKPGFVAVYNKLTKSSLTSDERVSRCFEWPRPTSIV
jgi:hypothetical protein